MTYTQPPPPSRPMFAAQLRANLELGKRDEWALILDEQRLSWGELAERVEQSSRFLRSQVSRDCVIGLMNPRTLTGLSMLFAAISDQRQFVTFDEEAPVRRILDYSERVGNIQLIELSGLDPVLGPRCPRPDPSTISKQNLYSIFTSGSTGVPKYLSISEAAVAIVIDGLTGLINDDLSDGPVGLTASCGFDVFIQQILLSIVLARPLVVASAETRRDPRAMISQWRQHRVALADTTPMFLRGLALTRGAERLTELSVLLVGGDVLTVEDVRQFSSVHPDVTIYNLYGVAECAIDSLAYRVASPEALMGDIVPVGWPLAESIKVAVAGETSSGGGELVISGPTLGTLNGVGDEEKIGFRTIGAAGRSYFTGDEATMAADGAIIVHGRIGRQIKVAGRRFDPVEIELLARQWLVQFRSRLDPSIQRSLTATAEAQRCHRCVLSSAHPDGASIGLSGLCNWCSDDRWRPTVEKYFKNDEAALAKILVNRGPATVFYSGGRDSTFVLTRLKHLGVACRAFLYDNGAISPLALANAQSTCQRLGVALDIRSADDAGKHLRESLVKTGTVCDGCFGQIERLGLAQARMNSSQYVVTGLAREQIVHTKLEPFLRRDPQQQLVDEAIGRGTKIYLGALGAEPLPHYDYFRYVDVAEGEIDDTLERLGDVWKAPSDTGTCSSNCLANDVGIAVHTLRHGYHNYEAPLAWAVRLGRLQRADALAKLTSVPSDLTWSRQAAGVLGSPEVAVIASGAAVELYTDLPISGAESGLMTHLANHLPRYLLPRRVRVLERLPRLTSGKIDYHALTVEQHQPAVLHSDALGSGDDKSDRLLASVVAIWSEVLGEAEIGTSSFIELGGDSLAAIEISEICREQFQLEAITPDIVYGSRSVAELAELIRRSEKPADRWTGIEHLRIITRGNSMEARIIIPGTIMGGISPLFQALGDTQMASTVSLLSASVEDRSWLSVGNTIPEIAARIAAGLESLTIGATGHLIVAGWSFGAVLAAELARVLNESGRFVGALYVDPPLTSWHTDSFVVDLEAALERGLPELALKGPPSIGGLAARLRIADRLDHGLPRLIRAWPSASRPTVLSPESTSRTSPLALLADSFDVLDRLDGPIAAADLPTWILASAGSGADWRAVGRDQLMHLADVHSHVGRRTTQFSHDRIASALAGAELEAAVRAIIRMLKRSQ